jgi:hypothetical protein
VGSIPTRPIMTNLLADAAPNQQGALQFLGIVVGLAIMVFSIYAHTKWKLNGYAAAVAAVGGFLLIAFGVGGMALLKAITG